MALSPGLLSAELGQSSAASMATKLATVEAELRAVRRDRDALQKDVEELCLAQSKGSGKRSGTGGANLVQVSVRHTSAP